MLVRPETENLDPSAHRSPPQVKGVSRRTARILIVEDERHIARLLEHVLRKAGYDPFVCPSGEEAIIRVRTFRPDAIILDLVLPGMSGLEVLNIVRAEPVACLCAVVILSNHWPLGERAAGVRDGNVVQCTKPIAPTTLIRKLEQLGVGHSLPLEL